MAPLKATQQLPSNYQLAKEIEMQGNWFLALGLNVASIFALGILGGPILFFTLFIWLPLLTPHTYKTVEAMVLDWPHLLSLVIALFLYIIIHELVHGAGFAWYTKARPYFGFTGLFAYAPHQIGISPVTNTS